VRNPFVCVCLFVVSILISGFSESVRAESIPTIAPADDAFLDDLEHRAWDFFNDSWKVDTGLISDRAKADGSAPGGLGSVASVGFGLSGICIADARGWIPRDQATERVRATLEAFQSRLVNEHGFFYHFYLTRDGSRAGKSELSSIDTALFLAGAVTAREYFKDLQITTLVNAIYERIDWPWMLDGGTTLRLGWTPEKGFIPYRWSRYSEHMVMDLVGIGAESHPLPPEEWKAWERKPVGKWSGYEFLECRPLFTHQYSQAYVDFRGKNDGIADYFENSRLATLAQRQMCIGLAAKYPHWGENVWGLSASDSAHGYVAWGGPPAHPAIDGTIVPCAPGGSIPFAPAECLAALRTMKEQYGDLAWAKYGFVDAFNPETGWKDKDVIGIDVGITLLQAENYRTALIWKTFMQAPEIRRAMELAGFHEGGKLKPGSSLVEQP